MSQEQPQKTYLHKGVPIKKFVEGLRGYRLANGSRNAIARTTYVVEHPSFCDGFKTLKEAKQFIESKINH